ncbi:MAG: mannose-6-phosphate isomerase, class I [Spirochaetales bacterium]|nr:mannose-6-phosphate isomerase, class I [Spirochaetales bacterium]
MKIYRLINESQNYAWGDTKFIPNLLGEKNKKNLPYAELWMGAHSKLPSKVVEGEEAMPLDQLIEADPEIFLGDEVAKKFHNSLPFLFKVLSAASPLSIQAHPNKKMAEEGFARENSLGIPLDAPFRNYKDDNHKPEIICALTDFTAMKGFRVIDAIIENFNSTNIDELITIAKTLDSNNPEESLRLFFKSLFEIDNDIIEKICFELKRNSSKSLEFKWVKKLLEFYPNDIGVLAPLYLNLVELKPNEALYLGAGELHAYLEGSGMELMANSDNVLRGGLTPKHIDLVQLNAVLEFCSSEVNIIRPEQVGVESIFTTPSDEFLLTMIDVDGVVELPAQNSISIMICVDGEIEAKDFREIIFSVERGNSFLVTPGEEPIVFSGKGRIYRASVPLV